MGRRTEQKGRFPRFEGLAGFSDAQSLGVSGAPSASSSYQLRHDPPMHIGETEIASVVAVGQALVVQAKQM